MNCAPVSLARPADSVVHAGERTTVPGPYGVAVGGHFCDELGREVVGLEPSGPEVSGRDVLRLDIGGQGVHVATLSASRAKPGVSACIDNGSSRH